jgi:hypothetical protein
MARAGGDPDHRGRVTHAYGLDLRITSESVAWSTVIAVVVAAAASAFV